MKATSVLYAVLAFTTFSAQAIAQEAKTIIARKPTLPSAAPVATSAPKVSPVSVTVNLGDQQIQGALIETASIEMKTSFGNATFPLAEVAGIKMADSNSAMTTIVLHNGDSVTGAIELQRLKVETTWGSASIKGENVTDVLFSPGLKWSSQSGLNGVRWTLVTADSASKITSSSVTNQGQSSSTTSSSRVISASQPYNSGQPVYGQPRVIRSR